MSAGEASSSIVPAPDPPFRFAFDEVVRIVSDDPELAPINGERGVVVGRGEDPTRPGYGVFVYRDARVWSVEEADLEPTGETDPRPEPTHAVRVRVDEQGRGHLAGVRRLERKGEGPGVRFPPPFLFVVGYVAGLGLHEVAPLALVPGGPTAFSVGLAWALVGLGAALIGWAMVTFAAARTAIIPNRPASQIVEAGPYRFSRNPMYVGLGLVYAGLALWLDRLWPLLLLPGVYAALWLLVVRREEAYLTSAFGETYEAYRRRIRRWL
jgi:protein-S-isoprenylcysteine O-methyltransferase Ste14